MKEITYKFVMDGTGLIIGVELWQGDQHITVSMEKSTDNHSGNQWSGVKDFMDRVTLPKYIDKNVRTAVELVDFIYGKD